MKRFLFLFGLMISLAGCTGSSGGTTTDVPPVVTPPVVIPPATPVFNSIQSSFHILNSSNVEISSAGVGDTIKLRLLAKDQFGNPMSGLNIKFAQINNVAPNINSTEISAGVYEASMIFNDQIQEEFSVLKDLVSVSLNKILFVSFCSGSSSLSASPFHNTTVQSGDTYYIICNASQLNQAKNFLTRNYIIGTNIDLSSFYVDSNSDLIPDNQFKIGDSTTGYSGKFKAYGLVVRNFKYLSSSENNVGFFGKLSAGASISGLVLDSPKVSGLNEVGSLAGSVEASSGSILISSSSVLNGENLSKSGNNHGGVIGLANGTGSSVTIDNCSFSSSLNLNTSISSRSYIGGFAGRITKINLTQNYFDASIVFDDKSQTVSFLGGISGELNNVTSFSGNSSNVALDVNSGSDVGGLSGKVINSTLTNSYTNTVFLDVTGSNSGDFSRFGGLFGSIESSNLTSVTAFINNSDIIKDPFGTVAFSVLSSNLTQIILNGSISFNSNDVGGMYSIVDNSSLDRNWNYMELSSTGANWNIGGIASLFKNSSMNRTLFEGSLNIPLSLYSGGLIAYSEESATVSNSAFKGSLLASQYVGGLAYSSIGTTPKIVITNSFSSGSITVNNNASGLIYDLVLDSEIRNSFVSSLIRDYSNLPLVSGNSITNQRNNNTSIINQVYYLSSRSGSVPCGLTSCSSEAIDTFTGNPNDLNYYFSSSNSPMSLWDFTTIWNSFGNFPFLRY